MKIHIIIILSIVILGLLGGCAANDDKNNEKMRFDSWDDVVMLGQNQEATIFMWGGNESINTFMDTYVAQNVKEKYGITLNRVPMNAPEFMSKLVNEKKGGVYNGTADILWINGENFKTAKQGQLLWGPFTELLPNLDKYYDLNSADLKFDTGVLIDGYEAIWGRAQLVFTYDTKVISQPPKSFAELIKWAKSNQGRFTYPKPPDDFAGVAFVRTAYYELTGESDIFQTEMSRDEFVDISQPVIEYFIELNQYLWKNGQALPATQGQQDELFKNGEIDITMGFEIGKTAGFIAKGDYPDSVRTFVFDTGTIGNSHYLAIPYNATNKAAALLVIDFLQSPSAQIEKMKSDVWGDMPAMDSSKLDDALLVELDGVESNDATLTIEELTANRLPEMQAQYIEWIKEIWVDSIGGK